MNYKANYPALFSPLALGPKTAKNRVWMTGHGTQLVQQHGFSPAHVDYYRERARGGVGVITTEAIAVHPTTQPYKGKVFGFDEKIVEQYAALAAAVHEFGTLLLAQPWHRGRETNGLVNRLPVWAPSAVPDAVYREMPRPMDDSDIAEIINGYRLTARYARLGGLDGVEVHGLAHGYLLGQFLSPATNFRTDSYGGSFENRLRLVREIIDITREEVGDELIVGVRINGEDGAVEGGLSNEDWIEIARALVGACSIDYVSVSRGTYLERMDIYGATPVEHGYQVEATAKVKAALPDVPVVVVGRITNPELAEWVLQQGKADMIGMTRTLIADPEWANKAASGSAADIRPCVGANWCMASIVNSPLACVHNPAVGREAELGFGTIQPGSPRKRVCVIGGGPAGLRAAYTSALRGHEISLFEREFELGGQVALMAKSHSFREWLGITDWLAEQIEKLGVEVRLGREVEPADFDTLDFDEFVFACGSTPIKTGWSSLRPAKWGDGSAVPGADQWNVYSIPEVFSPRAELGRSVMVFDDTGGRQAVVAAEYAVDSGRRVEIVTRLPQVAPDLEASRDLQATYRRLRQKGVVFTTDSELIEIDGDSMTLKDVWSDQVLVRENVDSVILSTGNTANVSLLNYAKGIDGLSVHAIGDCLSPRRIFNAIWEGELVGRLL